MPNKGKEKFITISVKNYSTRKHFREHQNNLLKEIYSPIRRESSSLKIRKSSRFNPSIMEEIPKATTAFDQIKEEVEDQNTPDLLFKKKKRKVNTKDKRRVIKNYKRCIFDKVENCEETLMNKINKVEGIADYYRTFHYNLEKDNNYIRTNCWKDLLRSKRISRHTYNSVYLSRQEKSHNRGQSFKRNPNHHRNSRLSEDLKKQVQFLAKEDTINFMNFSSGYTNDYQKMINQNFINLKEFQTRLKTSDSLKNLYENVKVCSKLDQYDLDKVKKNSLVATVALNQRIKKVGRVNKKVQIKMEQLNILQ